MSTEFDEVRRGYKERADELINNWKLLEDSFTRGHSFRGEQMGFLDYISRNLDDFSRHVSPKNLLVFLRIDEKLRKWNPSARDAVSYLGLVVQNTAFNVLAESRESELMFDEPPLTEEHDSAAGNDLSEAYSSAVCALLDFPDYLIERLTDFASDRNNPYDPRVYGVAARLQGARDKTHRQLEAIFNSHLKVRKPLSKD
ncbi:MAG: hypothetical protein IIA87_01425 [Nanoarchaeota archaeon]|nr:hypothetical protein [Nanoarchaeota archaeon]